LLPVEREAVGCGIPRQFEMVLGDAELVVQGARGMIVEGLAAVVFDGFVSEAIRIGGAAVRVRQIQIRDAMNPSVFKELL
jgi:hypothetical protein